MAVEDQIIALNLEIGRMQGMMDGMDKRITGLEEDIDVRLGSIETTLKEISSTLDQQRGGMRMLVGVGTFMASIGGLIGYIIQHFL